MTVSPRLSKMTRQNQLMYWAFTAESYSMWSLNCMKDGYMFTSFWSTQNGWMPNKREKIFYWIIFEEVFGLKRICCMINELNIVWQDRTKEILSCTIWILKINGVWRKVEEWTHGPVGQLNFSKEHIPSKPNRLYVIKWEISELIHLKLILE